MDQKHSSMLSGQHADSARPGSEEDQIRQLELHRQQQLSQKRAEPEIHESSQITAHHVTANTLHPAEPREIVRIIEEFARIAAAAEEYQHAEVLGGIHFTTRHGMVQDDGHVTVSLTIHDPQLSAQVRQKIHIYLVHENGRRAILRKTRRPANYDLRDITIAKLPTFDNADTPRELRVAREREARYEVRQRNAQIDGTIAQIDQRIEVLRRAIARRQQEDHAHRRGGNGDDDDDDHQGGGGGMRIKGRAGLQIRGAAQRYHGGGGGGGNVAASHYMSNTYGHR